MYKPVRVIGRLVGRIVEDGADGTLVLDVHGVGYEVLVPLGTVGRAPRDEEGDVTLFVHTHVREDAFLLYGFAARDDRSVFRQLIGISTIGPKIALSILGALSVGELAAAIARGETQKLTAVPGVGKKTAERIGLELKGKLIALSPIAVPSAVRAPLQGQKGDLLHGALTRLGYRPVEADRAISMLGSRVDSAPLPDLVREALALLSP